MKDIPPSAIAPAAKPAAAAPQARTAAARHAAPEPVSNSQDDIDAMLAASTKRRPEARSGRRSPTARCSN